MFGFIIATVIQIWTAIIRRAITRPPEAQAAKVQIPRVSESETIPAVFGTVKLAPSVLWLGDDPPVPIKGDRRVFGLVGPRPTIGHRYYLSMQGMLCWGAVDELVDIIVDDQYKLSESGPTSDRLVSGGGYTTTVSDAVTPALPAARVDAGQALVISAANLFGGKEQEGGILGDLRFYYGSATQAADAKLVDEVRDPFPAYPGLCYAVWDHMYIGTSPYPKTWHAVVRRCPNTLGTLAGNTALSRIGDDANPAEVLYELWTNTRWGLGKPASDLELASFLGALQTLYDEGTCGVSGTHGGTGEAQTKFDEVKRHIDAVFAPDPVTGKMRLTLIRADYDVATLEILTVKNSRELKAPRPVWGERTTQVKVTYTDREKNFTDRTRQAHNPAVERTQGYPSVAVVHYPLFSTPASAERAAARDCRVLSANLASGSIISDRGTIGLYPGAPFVINRPEDGLTNLVARVTRINLGSIHDEEQPVEIQWAEDVFGSPGGILVATPPEEGEPPPPANAGRRFDVETSLELSDTQGCLTLTITGDVTAITKVETQTQHGGEDADDWTEQDNSAPITVCVDRDDLEVGHIAYRITYTDGDGTEQTFEGDEEIPPLGVAGDPGVPLGTPGNWSHNFVPVDSGTFVLGAHGAAAESLGTGKYRRVLVAGGYVRGQATVVVAGYVTAYLDCRVSLDGGATWETDLLGLRVPLRDPDGLIGSQGFVQAVGFAVAVDPAFVGEVLLDAVVVGGDDTAVPEIQNFIVESTSAEPPPADGEDEPITPEIPRTADLLAAWKLEEGAGETIANKVAGSGGVPVLAVGSTTSAGDGHETTWATSPRRMTCPSLPSFQHTYCRYVFSAGEAAALANGFAIFLPFKPTSGPGDKFAFGIFDSTPGSRLAQFLYDNTAGRVPSAQALENSGGGGGTTRTATGSTPINNGVWHFLGLVATGTQLKIVIDGVVEASVACGPLMPGTAGTTYIDFGWPGTNLSFTNGPDNCDWGDPYVWIATGIDFTADELLAMYLEVKTTYTDLP